MTPKERIDRALKGTSWEEAEEAGIEVVARCMAMHIYGRKEGEGYFHGLMRRISVRADEWAHEPGNPLLLAFIALGNRKDESV